MKKELKQIKTLQGELYGKNKFTKLMKSLIESGLNVIISNDPETNTGNIYVTLTRETARQLLEFNIPHNREKSRNKKLIMIRDMNSGNWKFTGAPICVDVLGALYDGQNRLGSFTESDMEQMRVIIVYNMPVDTFLHVDSGRPRTIVDRLKMAGFTKKTQMFTVALRVLYCATENRLYDTTTREQPIDDLIAYANQYRAEIYNFVDLAEAEHAQYVKMDKLQGREAISKTEYVRFYSLFASISTVGMATDFMTQTIRSFGLQPNSPSHQLRQLIFAPSYDGQTIRLKISNAKVLGQFLIAFLAFKHNITNYKIDWNVKPPQVNPFN